MFETETVRPCLVQKLKWGGGGGGGPGPPGPPVAMPLVIILDALNTMSKIVSNETFLVK